MLAQAADTAISSDPWRFQWHPEVWILVAFLTSAFIYMVRVIGPKAVPAGEQAVTRKNIYAFVGAMLMLWVASDWPMHDISEEYLYSAHMLQHMMLSYFLPPLALIATPPWLLRVLIGNGGHVSRAHVPDQAGRRRRAVQRGRDDHPHSRSSSTARSTTVRSTTACTSSSCCSRC